MGLASGSGRFFYPRKRRSGNCFGGLGSTTEMPRREKLVAGGDLPPIGDNHFIGESPSIGKTRIRASCGSVCPSRLSLSHPVDSVARTSLYWLFISSGVPVSPVGEDGHEKE